MTRLANRLGAAEQGNVDAIVHLLHALGNTGAPSSVKTLMFYLQHDNIDVQIAAIGALRMHANEPMVQAAFTKLLENSHEEEVRTSYFLCCRAYEMSCGIILSLIFEL